MTKELPTIPGGWTETSVSVLHCDFHLQVPAQPDEFLDDPAVQQESEESDYMPYWPYLWGSAPLMARLILQAEWVSGTRALEIGAGIGLVGLAGLAAGLDVTFSDYDAAAVQLSLANSRSNGFSNAAGLVLDWRNLASSSMPERFPVILGCDVIYEPQVHKPILNVLGRLLVSGGLCWIADPGRAEAVTFIEMARQRGYCVSIRDEAGAELDSPAINQFQMLILQDSADGQW